MGSGGSCHYCKKYVCECDDTLMEHAQYILLDLIAGMGEEQSLPGVRYREPKRQASPIPPPKAVHAIGGHWTLLKPLPCSVCGEEVRRWDVLYCDARHAKCKVKEGI
jgi:hypothetical protein